MGLLQSCRALYTEAAALLYSANQFVIHAHKVSVEPLRALSPTAIASLTSLKIVLNETSCHSPINSSSYPPVCCCDDVERQPHPNSVRAYCARYHKMHHRPLLDPVSSGTDPSSPKSAAQALLTNWHDAAVHLSPHVRPGHLQLSLVCDISCQHEYTLEAGRLAIAPLALFPPLKDCHVRLCEQRDRALQRLAESAALDARFKSSILRLAPTKTPSALVDLPIELRLLILEYTDLVTPWKEVTWSRRFFRYQVCPPACHHYEHTCEPHIHHGCRLNQCLGVEPSARPAPSPGCFCRRRHAAFSSTCNCWDPPTSLFLVCRVLYRDAQLVFFSHNRFIVHDVQASPYWALDSITLGNEPEDSETVSTAVDYPYGRLAASHFLRDAIPIDCLAHLRFLELVFPPYGPHDWPVDQHPAIVDWRNTVKWLRGKINTPALTVRVVFADFFNDPAAHRWQTTQDEDLQIVRGYMDIAQPLRALVQHDGLASLFVQAAFPWSWGEAVTRRAAHPDSWWIQQLAEEEQRLKERLEGIPGREGLVDSRRKPEPGRSNWQTWYDVEWWS